MIKLDVIGLLEMIASYKWPASIYAFELNSDYKLDYQNTLMSLLVYVTIKKMYKRRVWYNILDF